MRSTFCELQHFALNFREQDLLMLCFRDNLGNQELFASGDDPRVGEELQPRLIAVLRTPLWLPLGWGCPGRRLSRE